MADSLEELRRQGLPFYDLTESNPTHCNFSYPPEILTALVNLENLKYEPQPQGVLAAREAVCAYYHRKGILIDPSQVFLTASTSEGYSFLFRLLMNPGEEALFPAPSYPLFQFLGDLNDIEMATYPLVYSQGQWQTDEKRIVKKISRKAKAICLVNPNNPTGSYVQSSELDLVNRLCRDNQLAIVADEVFLDYSFEKNQKPISLAGNSENLTFVLGGLSKTLGLPQMKLSWIVVNGPKPQMTSAIERLEVIADTYLSVNTPVQNALALWFDFQERIQKEIRERTRRNLDYVLENAPQAGGECLRAQGGWYAVLKLPDYIDEEPFTLELLEKDRVYIHPGYFFDFVEAPYAVLSLLPREDIFQEGVKRLIRRAT